MAKIVLFGNGQVASVAYYRLKYDSPHEVVAFTVDAAFIQDDTLLGLPVVPFEEVAAWYPPAEFQMLISISYRQVNRLRAEKYHQAKAKGYELISYISSRATVWAGSTIGDNCQIAEGSIIHPFVSIGNNVFVGTGSIVGHHTAIQDHCTLSTRVTVTGSNTIEAYSFLGAGSTIRDRVKIACECVISAGAVILEDTQPNEVYMAAAAELLPIASDDLPIA